MKLSKNPTNSKFDLDNDYRNKEFPPI